MRNKTVIFKAHNLRKKNPELTLKEAFRIASIRHNYKKEGKSIG